jgi:hypothetical protein
MYWVVVESVDREHATLASLRTRMGAAGEVVRVEVTDADGAAGARVSYRTREEAERAVELCGVEGSRVVMDASTEDVDAREQLREELKRARLELFQFKRFLAWYIDRGKKLYEAEGRLGEVAASFRADADRDAAELGVKEEERGE